MFKPELTDPVASQVLAIERRSGPNDVVRVDVRGELDIATVPSLRACVEDAAAAAGAVLVDMSELTFIDSMGIGLLVDLHRNAARDGWSLAFVPGPRQVQRPIQILGLEERLPFVEGLA